MGTWHSENGINITQNVAEVKEEVADSLKNSTLEVTTILVRNCLQQVTD